MKNYDEILKHITPQIKRADKLLRALEKRKFFNASGFTILSIPEYTAPAGSVSGSIRGRTTASA